jgi:hypothetical protein
MNEKLDKRLRYCEKTGKFINVSTGKALSAIEEREQIPWPNDGILSPVVKEALDAFKKGVYKEWLAERKRKQKGNK